MAARTPYLPAAALLRMESVRLSFSEEAMIAVFGSVNSTSRDMEGYVCNYQKLFLRVRKALRNRRVWREKHSENSSLRAEMPRHCSDLTGRRVEQCLGQDTGEVPALSSFPLFLRHLES
jgi:hypothetical protein